jgi:hypothetical protein
MQSETVDPLLACGQLKPSCSTIKDPRIRVEKDKMVKTSHGRVLNNSKMGTSSGVFDGKRRKKARDPLHIVVPPVILCLPASTRKHRQGTVHGTELLQC